MKGFTTLVAALVALALIGTASAAGPTVIRITGSTAYRGQVHAAIAHLMGATGAAPYTLTGGATYGFSGTSIGSATQAIFVGDIGNGPVIIKTSWLGSAGGVQVVSNSLTQQKYIDDNVAGLTATGTSGLSANASGELSDVAMSDTLQSATPFVDNLLEESSVDPLGVGVVPFKWVASNGAAAGLTNVTPQLIQALFGAGAIPLSQFTGNSADASAFVYAIGRDEDSGTRLTAFAETGLGALATVVQKQQELSGTAVTGVHDWPVNTVNGITYGLGDSGFASGGLLAAAMRNDSSAVGSFVTYLSTGDAATAISGSGGAGPAKELTYNGVAYSLTNVQEGLYTFWSYEHMLFPSSLDATKKLNANTIAARIHDFDASVLISSMHVQRNSDGALVTHQ